MIGLSSTFTSFSATTNPRLTRRIHGEGDQAGFDILSSRRTAAPDFRITVFSLFVFNAVFHFVIGLRLPDTSKIGYIKKTIRSVLKHLRTLYLWTH